MKAAPEKGRSCGTFPERREMVPECHRGRSLRAVAGICRAFPEVAGHCRKLRPSPSRERHGRSLRTIPTVAGRGRKPIVGKALLKIWFRAGSVSGTCLGRETFSGACGPWPEKVRSVPGRCGLWSEVEAIPVTRVAWPELTGRGRCGRKVQAAGHCGKAETERYRKGTAGNVVPER